MPIRAALGIEVTNNPLQDQAYLHLLGAMLRSDVADLRVQSLLKSPRTVFLRLQNEFSSRADCQWTFWGKKDFSDLLLEHIRSDTPLFRNAVETTVAIESYLDIVRDRNIVVASFVATEAVALGAGAWWVKRVRDGYASGQYVTEGWRFACELKKYVKMRPESFYTTPNGIVYWAWNQEPLLTYPLAPDDLWRQSVVKIGAAGLFNFFVGTMAICTLVQVRGTEIYARGQLKARHI